jgi:sugar/nucleoside kinase (ribokinase family)
MPFFDVVLVGNYTKDTIVSSAGTRQVDGGGFNYGAHATRMMGLDTAAVTRLAAEDRHVVEALEAIGVTVFPAFTPYSTQLRLVYPTAHVDQRVISATHTAGSFTPDQVRDLESRLFLVNGSMRDEVGLDVLGVLRAKGSLVAADVQAFVRVLDGDGTLVCREWPEMRQVLPQIDILKTDAVEAEMLTGSADIREAARMLAGWGPKEVILTHRDGVLALAAGRFYEARFHPRQLVGRSGRGDTCIASYAAKRLSATPEESLIWAAAATSLKLEAEGPLRRTASEVEELIARMYRAKTE